jgi:hypothetical protein
MKEVLSKKLFPLEYWRNFIDDAVVNTTYKLIKILVNEEIILKLLIELYFKFDKGIKF